LAGQGGNRVPPKLSDMDMQQFGPLASKLFLFERCDEETGCDLPART
jgi:hypothetical protein